MTNPCYDFALRPQSNIPNFYGEQQHTLVRRSPSPTSPTTPSSQDSIDDIKFNRQRSDRGRWKTDGKVSIAERSENSNNTSCHCRHCVCNHERVSHDFLDPSDHRPSHTIQKSALSVTHVDRQQAGRKPPISVPSVDHSLWNPMQLLRRPHTSTEQEKETSHLSDSWSNYRSSSYQLRPVTSRDARESYSPNRIPYKTSKVRSLRRNQLQQRKISPHKSPSNGRSSSKTPCVVNRRRSYIDTTTPRIEKSDMGCQTKRDEFPLTLKETSRVSPIRRVIAYDSFRYCHLFHNGKTFSCADQRRPSPCRCGVVACTPAIARRGCYKVGWQGRAQCQVPIMVPQTSCQGSRHGNCCEVGYHQGCHQGCHHEMCSRDELPSAQHGKCSKCRQPLP